MREKEELKEKFKQELKDQNYNIEQKYKDELSLLK